ncbi:GNAT family N-acetyltransferase [Thaumasiovibrio subtropicus]|uniref:GNAT family N-acetyltransferase n=1 Tax=Thaumasiovibrio subtropicus TaxID=1891207 RepID=UPI000B362CAC|nr:GNAT family N-acetyltransferase [Thaumasiovibrio subtropicus]
MKEQTVTIAETERLVVRHFDLNDASYILTQLNDPAFIQYIVDKKVRDLEAARDYLRNGPLQAYTKVGYGLNAVVLKSSNTVIGMCGLVLRSELPHPDLGYAFLPEFRRQGFAREAALAVIEHSKQAYHLETILAVTLPDNIASNALLKRLGFAFEGTQVLYGADNNLYSIRAQ